MGNEQLSDVDFLRSLAGHPHTEAILSLDAPDRLRVLADDLEKQRTESLEGLQTVVGECPSESGSLDEDAAILESLSREMEVNLDLFSHEADTRLRQDLLRIASRLKSLSKPACEYCNGHGFFFPNRGFELREEKEVRVRVCDCKVGRRLCPSELERKIANVIKGN